MEITNRSERSQKRWTLVWGLSSSIAIYRALEAIRIFVRSGHRVIPMLSSHATAFIQPLLVETLTGEKVYHDVMQLTDDHRGVHTSLARMADALVFAPASANLIAGLAHGLASDLLTTTFLAYDGWTVIAPAMNVYMWRHPNTQANIQRLKELGVIVVEPATGPQIDGDIGPGRLAEPEIIASTVLSILQKSSVLENQTVLVTAGPTREPIDPVRYLSNRSSGKMGMAIAESALRRGARVILISGPTHLIPHPGIQTVRVETADEMFQAVKKFMNDANWIVMCAAVADFKPENPLSQKAKKKEISSLTLKPTPDILAYLGKNRLPSQKVIGFAAETHDHLQNARQKLVRKNVDAIVLNPVDDPRMGFEVDTNRLTILTADGQIHESPLMKKRQLGDWFWDTILPWAEGQKDTSSVIPGSQPDSNPETDG